jgi:hypothetical protein
MNASPTAIDRSARVEEFVPIPAERGAACSRGLEALREQTEALRNQLEEVATP